MSRAEDLFGRLIAGGATEVMSFIAQPVTEGVVLGLQTIRRPWRWRIDSQQ
jgi:hypothetical protein